MAIVIPVYAKLSETGMITQLENLCVIGAFVCLFAFLMSSLVLIDFPDGADISNIRWIAKINGKELPQDLYICTAQNKSDNKHTVTQTLQCIF